MKETMFSRLQTWSTAIGAALLALASVGCGAYEPEPEVPQYQYADPAPRPMTAEELAAWQAAHPEAQSQGEEVAIGEDDVQADEYQDTDPSALTEFKPALDGHGKWVDDATYGTVWVPDSAEVGTDFEPYVTAGHWTYADDTDYVWVSDYSWGWAPFHYGRWVLLPGHGWVWIPGRQYAGAWVTWRTSPGYGYIGWAPMAPSYYWYNGAAVGWSFGFYHHYDHYAYCPRDRFFYGGGVRSYVVTGPAARVHYERTVEYVPPPAQRVAASPTVNGPGRVAASPTVNGRVAARPVVTRPGPRPETLGFGKDSIVAPPSNNGGLDRARTMAVPSTAVASGARAPTRTTLNRAPASVASIPSRTQQPSFRASNPSVGRPGVVAPSNGGGRVASSPSFRPSAPQTIRPSSAQPSFRPSSPSVSRSQPSFRPSSPSVSRSQPSVRPSAPSVSRPSVSRPSVSPSFRSSPSVSRPSVSRPSASPSFRSSPSISRPSISPSRPSAPSGGGRSISRPSVRRR